MNVAGSAVIPAAIPPMTVTTAPTFTAAVAPGTAPGSVWNIAGGVYAGGVVPIVTERRFLRDGAAIGAYGAATAYTVVAADQGKTITAQVRRTDSAVPPQVLTSTATGVAVIPSAPAADFTVAKTAQLLAAMIDSTNTTAARTIIMEPGNDTALIRAAKLTKPGARTTIRARNRNAGNAVRSRFLNADASAFSLDGFTFDGIVWGEHGQGRAGLPGRRGQGVRRERLPEPHLPQLHGQGQPPGDGVPGRPADQPGPLRPPERHDGRGARVHRGAACSTACQILRVQSRTTSTAPRRPTGSPRTSTATRATVGRAEPPRGLPVRPKVADAGRARR